MTTTDTVIISLTTISLGSALICQGINLHLKKVKREVPSAKPPVAARLPNLVSPISGYFPMLYDPSVCPQYRTAATPTSLYCIACGHDRQDHWDQKQLPPPPLTPEHQARLREIEMELGDE